MNIAARFSFRGVTTAAVSLATLSAVALGAAPGVAAAEAGDTAVRAHKAQPADGGRNGGSTTRTGSRGYSLKFTKNWDDPDRSTLSLVRDGAVVRTYRAGSGLGSTDECASNRGWLPNGTYQVRGHQTNRGGDIKGYAIQLSDKVCHPKHGRRAAVKRDSLFIHSEMTRNGSQGSTEPTRWNGDADYTSPGSIKLRPEHIKDLFSRLEKAHWPKNLTLHVN
ncbi:L,D-transpeptidase family protein [Streptomyces sp. NPDC090445]|uniref:L,D-transpeptidase family protein n=1 Tax=Streptomyces sp. NPDC090445 TaxID=3365963 RepID=UPI003819A3FE